MTPPGWLVSVSDWPFKAAEAAVHSSNWLRTLQLPQLTRDCSQMCNKIQFGLVWCEDVPTLGIPLPSKPSLEPKSRIIISLVRLVISILNTEQDTSYYSFFFQFVKLLTKCQYLNFHSVSLSYAFSSIIFTIWLSSCFSKKFTTQHSSFTQILVSSPRS